MLRPKRFLSLKWRSTLSPSLSTQLEPDTLLQICWAFSREGGGQLPFTPPSWIYKLWMVFTKHYPQASLFSPCLHVTPGAWMSILFCSALGTDLGEKQGPTWLPAQDSGVHSSCLAGPWLQAAPGGGGNRGSAGAAGELNHRAVYTGKRPPPG